MIILDGFDEFDPEKNQSIMAVIRGEAFPQCSVLLTSRPHNVGDVETNFQNVLGIKGFSQEHMQAFCSKLLKGEEKAEAVLSFYKNNFLQGSVLYASPMLLQFVCVLVENDPDMDLTQRNVPRGEIYFHLVQCIYRKYCDGKGIRLDKAELWQVLIRIGKFASKTIRQKQNCFQREEIIRELGENVFELGFIVGYEDFRLAASETSDILVAFLHETMRIFLACLYVYQKECSGQMLQIWDTAGSLEEFSMGTDEGFVLSKCTQDVDYLHFYLYCFFCGNADSTFGWVLFNMCFNEFNVRTLHLTEFQKLFSAINIRNAIARKDDLVLLFIRAGLSRCDAAEHIFLDVNDPVAWILESLRHLRDKIKLVRILNPICAIQGLDTVRSLRRRRVIMDSFIHVDVDKVLQFCSGPFDVVVIADTAYRFAAENDSEQPINVSAFMRPGVCQLHIIGLSKGDKTQRLCTMSEDLQSCSNLTHLVFNYVRIGQSVVTCLTRAVRDGDVPLLEHLDFTGCTFEGNSSLVDLFEPAWPMLIHLNLNQCHLTEKDQALPPRLENAAKLSKFQSVVLYCVRFGLPTPWPNLKSVWLHGLDISSYQIVLVTVNTGNLPGLNELGLAMVEDSTQNTDYIKPIEHQTLTHLTLHNVIRTMKHLYTISKSKCLTNLQKLDISHSLGLRGSLSILLCHSLLSLDTLILKNCGLSSQDLRSLAEANVKGRIPELKHLHISQNILFENDLNKLFDSGCKWERLVQLNIEGTSLNCFSDLNAKVKSGCLLGLEELCISEDVDSLDVTDCTWPLLTDLQVYPNHCHDDEKLFSTVKEIITRNRFPSLENVFVSRKPQTDVSPARQRMFERWTSSCKPELVEKSMRLISRALEKELGKQDKFRGS